MTAIIFYFQVHQPYRLRRYTFFDIGRTDMYFDETENARLVQRVAKKCYQPMNRLLLRLIRETDGDFRCAFSLSGTVINQLEKWSPETLESFVQLADTGCVEFLCETSHHSLSFLADPIEFDLQVSNHARRIESLFGQRPMTFRNTELVCDNRIARRAEELGFSTILAEGADRLLGWRSSNQVYRPEGCESIKLLLRSYRLSDDIAFRFSNRAWKEWPLSVETFTDWMQDLSEDSTYIGLFMDYETFGEHQWEDTGIFEFMRHMPHEARRRGGFRFLTPGEFADQSDPISRLDMQHSISWADAERDLTAWLGNHMQRAAHDALYDLAERAREVGDAGHSQLLEDWRRLTISDHLYYMCTKWFTDGDVHKYFSPYASPHDAFIAFMNVLDDLERRIEKARASKLTAIA